MWISEIIILLSKKTADLLINNLTAQIPEVDIVIINQQVPSGIHTVYFKQKLLSVIHQVSQRKISLSTAGTLTIIIMAQYGR